jgi:hypothetical protein
MNTSDFSARMGSLDQDIMISQGKTIKGLIDRAVLVRMFTCSNRSSDPYYVSEYLGDLTEKLFEVSKKKQSTNWLRNMQAEYVKALQKLLDEKSADGGHPFNNVTLADAKAELDKIMSIASTKAEKGDVSIRNHFAYLKYILEQ